MPFRGSPERNPVKIPIRNPDGSVNVHCRECGHFICRRFASGYGMFSSAICHFCANSLPRPIDYMDPQEALLLEIYSQQDLEGSIEKVSKPKNKKFNILDLVVNTVKALGYRAKEYSEMNTEEIKYMTADNESSKQVAKRKKRVPIFNKDKDK